MNTITLSLAASLLAATSAASQDPYVWTRIAPSTTTPQAVTGKLVYDVANDVHVLYDQGRTWLWNGADWREATAGSAAPSARDGFALAFDFTRDRVVLFGGYDATGAALAETWERDATGWRRAVTANAPPARANAALSFDSTSGSMLLFGGGDSNFRLLGDTWRYDGVDWTPLVTAAAPSPRARHTMTDFFGVGPVLFGGATALSSPQASDETWIWNGTGWSPVTSPQSPSPRDSAQSVFELTANRVLLFGGQFGTSGSVVGVPGTVITQLDDLWEFDGASWTQIDPLGEVAASFATSMSWDIVRSRAVLFDSAPIQSGPTTWELERVPANAAKFYSFGAGCSFLGAAPSLELANGALPQLGGNLQFAVRNVPTSPGIVYLFLGRSRDDWNGVPLPVSLATSFGLMQSCQAFISLDSGLFLPAPGGRADLLLPIPADPAAQGFTFFAQALAFDDQNLLSFGRLTGYVSNAAGVVLGQ